jgi:hypothetical protein
VDGVRAAAVAVSPCYDGRRLTKTRGIAEKEINIVGDAKKKGAKPSTARNKRVRRPAGNKVKSFRELKAFGLWADRTDVKDPVEFTKQLRKRMEHGEDRR